MIKKSARYISIDEAKKILLKYEFDNILSNITYSDNTYILNKKQSEVSNCPSIDMLYSITFLALGNIELSEKFITPNWSLFSIKGDALINAVFSEYLSLMYSVRTEYSLNAFKMS